jgi:cytochrome c oxidase assembly protein subunit 15
MLENRFTWLTIFATFLLLIVGGTVNPTGSSLACPEPTLICHGELFPEMTGGVLYEHGHRLMGMSVGLLQITLTLLLWRRRRSLRWLGVAALIMVCVQGGLGALTVHYKLPWEVSTAHLLVAMCYLAILLFIAFQTRSSEDAPAVARASLRTLRAWIGVAAATVLLQILLGGLMRHHGGALASVDLPFHHGSLWPDGPLALKLHMAHRIGGVIAGLVAAAVAIVVWRRAPALRWMRGLALAVPVIVCAQIALGLLTIASLRYVPIAVAHFGGAVLLWSVLWVMWLTARGVAPAPAGREPGALGMLHGAHGARR